MSNVGHVFGKDIREILNVMDDGGVCSSCACTELLSFSIIRSSLALKNNKVRHLMRGLRGHTRECNVRGVLFQLKSGTY